MIGSFTRLNKNYGRRRTRLRAHKRFGEILHTKGYSEASTKGFYTRESRDISLTLAYSGLGAKYKDTAGIEHLAKTLESYYTFKLEHFCDRYANVTLDWDYDARTVRCSMPGYVDKVLMELQFPRPKRKRESPSKDVPCRKAFMAQEYPGLNEGYEEKDRWPEKWK